MEWHSFYYNGLETNIEVTKCCKVRRIKVEFMKYNSKIGEIDFSKLKLHPQNYKHIGVNINGLKCKTIKLHQIIASVFLGYEFKGHSLVVDHIDGDTLNNNLDNLQIITQRENCSKERSLKKGLPTGVSFNKRDKKYQTQIQINKKIHYLGYFNTPEEALTAYENKLKSIVN
jgi:hypothetical protein